MACYGAKSLKSGDSETDTEKVYFFICNFALEMNPLLKGIGG